MISPNITPSTTPPHIVPNITLHTTSHTIPNTTPHIIPNTTPAATSPLTAATTPPATATTPPVTAPTTPSATTAPPPTAISTPPAAGAVTTTPPTATTDKNKKLEKVLRIINELRGDDQMMDIDEVSDTRIEEAPPLVQLYINANRAVRRASEGNQLEIRSWYQYAEGFERKVNQILSNSRVALKTAKTTVYKEIRKHLPSRYWGISKIDQIRSFTANQLSKLTPQQIEIIKAG
ncbi:460_t:CDS:2, partial [Dentiscutata heterogama]